jgi:hypothetical protein
MSLSTERWETPADHTIPPSFNPPSDYMTGVLDFYRNEHEHLTRMLEESAAESCLPDVPSAKPALNDLLIRLRRLRWD